MTMYKNEEVLRAYLGYMRTEEPTIVFIAKNLVKDLDTKKKWIHVVDFDYWGIRGAKSAFNYIIVELFDRKLTWRIAASGRILTTTYAKPQITCLQS